MNSWNVPGQSDARGAIRNLAKTNIIFVLATRFRGGARVPARLVFRHVFIATFDAPIPTCVGWNCGVSNVGHSQQPFFRTFWFGFSDKACVDFVASLNKVLKFADILPELLKYDWFVNSCAPPTNWRFAGDWFDVAPSGEFPTLHP